MTQFVSHSLYRGFAPAAFVKKYTLGRLSLLPSVGR